MTPRCKDCFFYVTGKTLLRHGFCHRYPPSGAIGRWPQVEGRKWCGEFEKKKLRTPRKKVAH